MKVRLLTVVAVALFLSARGAYAQNQYNLPHFVNGNLGMIYKTSFILFNNSDAAVTATLKLTDNNGSPLSANISGLGSGSQFTISLDAGATKIYQTDGTGSSQGAATVTASAPIGVSAVFTVYDSAGNFVSESGVGASELMTDFFLPVDSTGSALTGLALFNPGTTDASLTLSLFNQDGSPGGTQAVPLKSGNHMAAFVALAAPGQFFPSLTSFRGTLRVQSTVSIAAMVLRMYQTSSTTSFTSLPVVPRSSTKSLLNLAHVANGSYGSISFKSSFLIFNISSSAANVTLALTKDDGSPLTVTIPGSGPGTGTNSSFSIPIPAGGSVFLQTDGSGAGNSGAATITSNVPVGASAIFTVLNSTGQFQTEAGVGDSPVLTSLTLPVDITGLSDTGVAFYNPQSSSVTLTFKLLDASGVLMGTTTRPIPAKGHLAGFVDNPFFPGTSNFRGSMAVSSPAGVSSTVLRQYNYGANYTTLPTVSGTATGKVAVAPLLSKTVTGVNPPSRNDATLQPGLILSGTVSGAGKAQTIFASAGGSNLYSGSVDSATGKYLIVLPSGAYQLTAFYQPTGSNAAVTVTYSDFATVTVTSNTTRDVTLPSVSLFPVSGSVSGLSALPSGFATEIVFTSSDNTMEGTFTLDAAGNYSGVLPSGNYRASFVRGGIQFSPLQSQSALTIYSLGTLSVSGAPATGSFSIPSTATLSGTINGLGSSGFFGGTSVDASDSSAPVPTQLVCCAFPATSAAMPSILNNQYQMILALNRSYTLQVSTLVVQGTTLLGIATYPLSSTPVNLTANSVLDFNFPALPSTSTISGRVTDSSGKGVAKVAVSAYSQSITGAANLEFVAVATTDSNGDYTLTVLSGTNYTVVFYPPSPTP